MDDPDHHTSDASSWETKFREWEPCSSIMEEVFTAPTFLIRTSFGETLGFPLGTLDADKVA
jgi:hypothetical protein